MKRIILIVIRVLWILPYWVFVKLRKYKHLDKYSLEERYAFIHKIVFRITKKARVKIECFGLENLPEKQGYFMVPNHQGLFDPLAIFQTHEKPARAIVKMELTKVVLIRDVITILEHVPMKRDDIRESVKIIKYASQQLLKGQNFFVFAEGTRSRDKNNILEFKGGTFKIPMNAKAPIVPIAIIDSYKVFDNNSAKKITVQIHYLKPIYFEEYAGMHSNEIAELVHDRIEECIKKYE